MAALKGNRIFSFLVILIIYVVAAAAGIAVFLALPGLHILLRLAAADYASTLLVWAAGVCLNNSSVYDPYWSVAPVVMAPLAAAWLGVRGAAAWLLIAVIFLWGVRLTVNWALTFRNLNVQDWRYDKLKAENPRFWFIVNLIGINVMPTTVVLLVMDPAFLLLMKAPAPGFWMYAGALLSVAAVVLQAVADAQMRRFKRSAAGMGGVNCEGVWRYIRHPNYLGEILMWWGVYFMMLSADASLWPALIGPLCNTLLFVTVSIPLMEGRQLRNKPGYSDYRARTGMLLPRLSISHR